MIEDRLRTTIRTTIAAVFDEELNIFLPRVKYGQGQGAVKGCRHEHCQRQITSTLGTETVSVPRAHLQDGSSTTSKWCSKALGRYQRAPVS